MDERVIALLSSQKKGKAKATEWTARLVAACFRRLKGKMSAGLVLRDVPFPHGELHSFEGAVTSEGFELAFGHGPCFFERQGQYLGAGLKGRFPGRGGFLVVGTDGLAEVTASQVAMKVGRGRKGGPMLQGLVADAFIGVQEARFFQGTHRAGVQTGGAGLAKVLHWSIKDQFGVGEDLPQEQEGPEGFVEKQGVLSDPTESRLGGETSFEDRPGIRVDLCSGRGRQFVGDELRETLQF